MLAIDPEHGGLFPRHRRRFRKALALAYRADEGKESGSAWMAGRARRKARRELKDAGLLHSANPFGGPRLTDRGPARKRFQALKRGIEENQVDDPRDQQLLLLLALSGVLAHRLSRDERRLAARRLRTIVEVRRRAGLIPPAEGPQAQASQGIVALGIVDLLGRSDLLAGAVGDLDASGTVGGSGVGGDGWDGSGNP